MAPFENFDPYAATRHQLRTLDDWRAWVAWEPPKHPGHLTSRVYMALDAGQRRTYDRERRAWHVNLPLIEHDDVKWIFSLIEETMEANSESRPGARGGLVVDAPAGTGKSTLLQVAGKAFERATRRHHGDRAPVNPLHEWAPAVFLPLGARTSMDAFNRGICAFFRLQTTLKGDDLTRLVENLLIDCGTMLLLVDDIDRMVNTPTRGSELNAFLKGMLTNTPATHVYAGIDTLDNAGLGTRKGIDANVRGQTRSRFQIAPIGNFKRPIGDDATEDQWTRLLESLEPAIVLVERDPRMLRDLGDYLYDRTNGNMRSLTTLLKKGANRAIADGSERLGKPLLDVIDTDHESETQASGSGRPSVWERRGLLAPEQRKAVDKLTARNGRKP